MDLIPNPIHGVYEIQSALFSDARGVFVKTFHDQLFEELGLRRDWKEEYYSVSAKNVIRGMHFQTPPHEHAKLVHCLAGEALDVLVDLRVGSPSFGKVTSLTLSPEKSRSLYIPAGIAHGFLALRDNTIMHYKVTSMYSSAHDAGILWSSLGFEWPVDEAIVSERDARHPRVEDFLSPFTFSNGQIS